MVFVAPAAAATHAPLQRRSTIIQDESLTLAFPSPPWNKCKLMGVKPPLRPKHVWVIRTRLMVEGRTRDLAMFNTAIDNKLRGCHVVAPKVDDIAPHGYTIDRAGRFRSILSLG